ncbi:phage tail tape measure protein [Paenibacillus sp. NFR01]|uniref:phage tail tape measure protein n=1 Tax=Paenibacillus sp. NFR01 TaxID=1566279 RepID=UPI0008D292B3|nr:phage tail tape measure protein [Paenibacillus sp. NFR01]SET95342.1 hypothetical protein SAMN03159358_2842 [Paenibacillus sp. NFR01]
MPKLRRRRYGLRDRRDAGSVSIFLIMVLAVLFLFAAVLIDFARIAASNVQQERLARAGVRSVMSSYDTQLHEKYGLFAFSGDRGEQILSEVLGDNLYESGRSDAFNLLPVKLDSSTLEMSRPLGEFEVFRRQIGEEMKYKAPIDAVLELAAKFKPISGAMEEASRSTKLLAKLQPLYDEREAALDEMLEKRKLVGDRVRDLERLIVNLPGREVVNEPVGTMDSAADIVAMHADYVAKYFSDVYRDKDEPARFTSTISYYITQTGDIRMRIVPAIEQFHSRHTALLEEAEAALKHADELNTQMKEVLDQARNSGAEQGEANAAGWDIPGDSSSPAVSLQSLREQEEALLLNEAELREWYAGITGQEQASKAVDSAVTILPGALAEAVSPTADIAPAYLAVRNAAEAAEGYFNKYGSAGSEMTQATAKLDARRVPDKQRKQIEKEAKAKLGDAVKLLNQIRSLGSAAQEAQDSFDELEQFYAEVVEFNHAASSEQQPVVPENNLYPAGGQAMENADGIYDALGTVMGGARDRLFLSEYAALYFSYFDPSQLGGMMSGTAEPLGEDIAAALDPSAQELEYVLYGISHPAANVAAAYSEIFALSLAVRTMEGFMESAKLGNPLAILAAALLYGVEHAAADMVQLCKEGEIPLSKYLPVRLSYRDYLRLFLLSHGSGEGQLARMLAVIRQQTGRNPVESYTYASAEIRLGLRLWFLPGAVKVLNKNGTLPGSVEGNVYFKTVKADFSY